MPVCVCAIHKKRDFGINILQKVRASSLSRLSSSSSSSAAAAASLCDSLPLSSLLCAAVCRSIAHCAMDALKNFLVSLCVLRYGRRAVCLQVRASLGHSLVLRARSERNTHTHTHTHTHLWPQRVGTF